MLSRFTLKLALDGALDSEAVLQAQVGQQVFHSKPATQPQLLLHCEFQDPDDPLLELTIIKDRQVLFFSEPIGPVKLRDMLTKQRSFVSFKSNLFFSLTRRFFYVELFASDLKIEKTGEPARPSKVRQVEPPALSAARFDVDEYVARAESRLTAKGHYARSLSKDSPEQLLGRVLVHILQKAMRAKSDYSNTDGLLCSLKKLSFIPAQAACSYTEYDFFPGNVARNVPEFDAWDLNARFLSSSETCQLPNGDFLLAGGCSYDNVVKYKHLMVLSPKLRRTFTVGTLPHYRKGHTVRYIDGKVYVLGGRINQETVFSKKVWCFNVQKGVWQDKPDLIQGYEINLKDYLEVFTDKKCLYVILRKNFAMESLDLTDPAAAWKKIDEPKSIKTFSNLALLREEPAETYFLLQDFLNETTFHLVSFVHESKQFNALKSVVLAVEVNLKYYFTAQDHMYFLLESSYNFSRLNIKKAIANSDLKSACELFHNPKISLAVSEIITSKRDQATLFLTENFQQETNFNGEWFCLGKNAVFFLAQTTKGNPPAAVSVMQAYTFPKKIRATQPNLPQFDLSRASVLPLSDGTLFVNNWECDKGFWKGVTFFFTTQGYIIAQNNSVPRLGPTSS